MPRGARVKSATGIYHIVMRGNNKETIFFDDEDKRVFLNRIKITKESIDFEIYAICVMDNHVHLLIDSKNAELGLIMQKILSSYVYWYNSKYERIGYLFQDRFKSEPIETDEYLMCAARYIHQNPVRAKMCDSVWDYHFSSARLYLNCKQSFINTQKITEIIGEKNLKEFMESSEDKSFIEFENSIRITEEKAREKIREILARNNLENYQAAPYKLRRPLLQLFIEIDGISLTQIAKITGVSYNFLRTL